MNIFVLDKWDYHLIQKIIFLAEKFVNETGYEITFSRDAVYRRLHEAFFYPDGDIIVCMDGDDVCGGAVVYSMADWQVEKFGYTEKFFVDPKHRRSGVGRRMTKFITEWFDKHDCAYSFVTSTAEIEETRLFSNLMAKFGYTDIGPTLKRVKNHGKIKTKDTKGT